MNCIRIFGETISTSVSTWRTLAGNSRLTSSILLKRSAKFGSFNAVTSFIAPLTDFSSERSFTSSVALTGLSPEKENKRLVERLIVLLTYQTMEKMMESKNDLASSCRITYCCSTMQWALRCICQGKFQHWKPHHQVRWYHDQKLLFLRYFSGSEYTNIDNSAWIEIKQSNN